MSFSISPVHKETRHKDDDFFPRGVQLPPRIHPCSSTFTSSFPPFSTFSSSTLPCSLIFLPPFPFFVLIFPLFLFILLFSPSSLSLSTSLSTLPLSFSCSSFPSFSSFSSSPLSSFSYRLRPSFLFYHSSSFSSRPFPPSFLIPCLLRVIFVLILIIYFHSPPSCSPCLCLLHLLLFLSLFCHLFILFVFLLSISFFLLFVFSTFVFSCFFPPSPSLHSLVKYGGHL